MSDDKQTPEAKNNEPGSQDAAAAAPADPAPEQQSQPTQEASRPEHIPEKFWDPEAKAIRSESVLSAYLDLEKVGRKRLEEMSPEDKAQLAKSLGLEGDKINELREQFMQERLADRPEKPEDYTFDKGGVPEGLEFNSDAPDPMLAWWREFAFEHGLTNDQYGQGISRWLGSIAESMPNLEEEQKKLGENAVTRIEKVNTTFEKAGLTQGEIQAINLAVSSADAVVALEKLIAYRGAPSMETNRAAPAQSLTLDELRALQLSKEYMNGDPATVKRVSEGYDRLYAQAS